MIRPFGRSVVPAPTAGEAAEADRRAIETLGVPSPVLMENAGRSAAQIVDRLYPDGPVHALVGSGNNGGDALVLLRTLASWGRTVRGFTLGADRAHDPLLHGWEGSGIDVEPWSPTAGASDPPPAVFVDGMLGTGLEGSPREPVGQAIRWLRQRKLPVVALDIPSGVNGSSGAVEGDAVRADVTVAFGWPKLGSLLHPGREHVGRLVAVEIGFPQESSDFWTSDSSTSDSFPSRLITPEWADAQRPLRTSRSHKTQVGVLLLLAGREGMAGAAVLAGRAALRSGVGLLYIASSPGNRGILQETLPDAIFVDADSEADVGRAAERADACAIGPGIGLDDDAVRRLTRVSALRGERPTVLDADALTLLAAGSVGTLTDWAKAGPVLVTPHLGEMARLTGQETGALSTRPVESGRGLSGDSGATVLLKGRPSIVAAPDGAVWIETVGTSDLATAGMGDVLTGAAGALLAQGLPADHAAALALHWTGRAALLAGQGAGLTPSDVCERIPEAGEERGPGHSDLDLPFVTFDQDPSR